MPVPDKDTLLHLERFVEVYPPQLPFIEARPPTTVYLQADKRFKVTLEETLSPAYGLWRYEQLAEHHNVWDAEHDSLEFAASLYKALEPNLSLFVLRDLAKVFNEELARATAEHDAALRRLNLMKEQGTL